MAMRSKKPADVAERVSGRRERRAATPPGWRRETFRLPRAEAREKAKEWFALYPKAAYLTEINRGGCCPTARSSSSCAGCRRRTELFPHAASGGSQI